MYYGHVYAIYTLGQGCSWYWCLLIKFLLFAVDGVIYSTDSHPDSDPDSLAILDESECVLLNIILLFLSGLIIFCSKYTCTLLHLLYTSIISTF